jgi:hypothetical protein
MAREQGLSAQEVAERVALLKRYRELLIAKRRKFSDYLESLESRAAEMREGDIDTLVGHVELEQAIVGELFEVEKALKPLEDIYREAYPYKRDDELPKLKADFENLKKEVIARNEENRALLRQRMDMLRQEIKGLRNPYAQKKKSPYSQAGEASVVDIKG